MWLLNFSSRCLRGVNHSKNYRTLLQKVKKKSKKSQKSKKKSQKVKNKVKKSKIKSKSQKKSKILRKKVKKSRKSLEKVKKFLEWADGRSKIYKRWAFLERFGREILGARGRWAFPSGKS